MFLSSHLVRPHSAPLPDLHGHGTRHNVTRRQVLGSGRVPAGQYRAVHQAQHMTPSTHVSITLLCQPGGSCIPAANTHLRHHPASSPVSCRSTLFLPVRNPNSMLHQMPHNMPQTHIHRQTCLKHTYTPITHRSMKRSPSLFLRMPPSPREPSVIRQPAP